MNLLAVPRRVRSDLRSFFPRAARAFKVLTNLLATGTGGVQVLLRVALDLGRAAPTCRDFVTKLAQSVGEFGLINGGGELLRGEEALRLNSARLSTAAVISPDFNRRRGVIG